MKLSDIEKHTKYVQKSDQYSLNCDYASRLRTN